jgi:hypothetical protein
MTDITDSVDDELSIRISCCEREGDGVWVEFVYCREFGIKLKRVWIHTTRNYAFVRWENEDGRLSFNKGGTLVGADGEPRFIRTKVDGKGFFRHRMMALASGIMTLEQYHDETLVVKHKSRREEDAHPDDRPENLEVGTHKENRNDPGNKTRVQQSSGKSVKMTYKNTGETFTLPSALAAAQRMGIRNCTNLHAYLRGELNRLPEGKGADWEAEWDLDGGFKVTDAIRIPGVPDDDPRRLSPTATPNPLLIILENGEYVFSRNRPDNYGYARTLIGKKKKRIHRLMFMTFKRYEFYAKLATMPYGTPESFIHIDHIDGNTLNNSLSNLAALTPSEHVRKSYKRTKH